MHLKAEDQYEGFYYTNYQELRVEFAILLRIQEDKNPHRRPGVTRGRIEVMDYVPRTISVPMFDLYKTESEAVEAMIDYMDSIKRGHQTVIEELERKKKELREDFKKRQAADARAAKREEAKEGRKVKP